jgi:Spy/CpxP family protein refolding chaperone
MKGLFVTMGIVALALALSTTALCQEKEQPGQQQGYGREGQRSGPMGYGWGPDDMKDSGYGMRPDYSLPGPLNSLEPADRKKWEKLWADYLMETMETRKQIAVKRIELEALWAQPDFDRAKIEKLSNELSELYAKRMKACDNYELKARKEFGQLGWACPIGRW